MEDHRDNGNSRKEGQGGRGERGSRWKFHYFLYGTCMCSCLHVGAKELVCGYM